MKKFDKKLDKKLKKEEKRLAELLDKYDEKENEELPVVIDDLDADPEDDWKELLGIGRKTGPSKKKMIKKIRKAEKTYHQRHLMFLQLAAETELSEDRTMFEKMAHNENVRRIVLLTLMSELGIERREEGWKE